jgi:hypothetical protein
MADRIQARAIRRTGELLKEYDAQGKRTERANRAKKLAEMPVAMSGATAVETSSRG